jgi:hypothetical protein
MSSLLGRSVTFTALWRVQAPPATVLMKASTGSPLLCEKSFGQGRVMLFTSTCDRDWTNFPIRPSFLPWTHRLVAYLAQKPLGHQGFYKTGEVVRLPVLSGDATVPLLVEKPNKAIAPATLSTEETPAFLFGETVELGVYKVRTTDTKGVAGMFAVNLENYESDLTYLDDVLAKQEPSVEAGLKKLLNRPLVTYVEDPESLGEGDASGRHGLKLWDWFLMVVLAIGLFEPWLANRISARLYARARGVPEVVGSSGRGGRTGPVRAAGPGSVEGAPP